jgi:hypothetical protein
MAITQTAGELIPELRGIQLRLLLAGGAGALLALAGLWSNPPQFFQSYLMAYMFCLGITLGCLALGMIHQLSGGAWGKLIRRPIGGGAGAAGSQRAVPADYLRHALPLRRRTPTSSPRVNAAAQKLYLNTRSSWCAPRLFRGLERAVVFPERRGWNRPHRRSASARRMQMLSGGVSSPTA